MTTERRMNENGFSTQVWEVALKFAIRHRKNSRSCKTPRGAAVGDFLMSVVHTCRLNKINPLDYFAALRQHAELAKREPTYANGSPTTVIGPPTTGTRVLREFWRDALGGEWLCAAAGTPGTWTQITPAPVTADPTTGTIPVGYLVFNTSQNLVKQHQGGYVWTAAGASAHIRQASDITDSTTAGRGLLTATDDAAQRTALGLGDAAGFRALGRTLLCKPEA
jgi:hypothetical protein